MSEELYLARTADVCATSAPSGADAGAHASRKASAFRLRRSADISLVFRRGVRATGGRPARIVIHMCWRTLGTTSLRAPGRVAFAIPRSVGPAVTRNRVRRQVRGILTERLAQSPGVDVVVRILPPAATATRRELATAAISAWDRAARALPACAAGQQRPGTDVKAEQA